MRRDLVFRRLTQQDGARVQAFVRGLSPRSRHERYFSAIAELPPRELERTTRRSDPRDASLAAFGRGDFGTAARLLKGLPPVAHRIGGSHAQRDVLQLTRAAALRSAPRSAGGWRRAPESAIGFA